MCRYWNKGIEVILILVSEVILVTLCNFKNGFGSWDNVRNHNPGKITSISKLCNENICGRVSLYSNQYLRGSL